MGNGITVSSKKVIGWFLVIWTLLNIVQASTLELHADEAYYWLYSRFLDWGYFDHPPMVALFIKVGDLLMHNELGLRLINIIASTASIYILWRVAKSMGASARWFALVAGGMFTLHIYGFITTPDGPLLLFTALFFLVYKRYLTENKLWQVLALGAIIAGLLYSKYHGILLVFFTLVANPQVLKRGSFWLIATIAVVLYTPHIYWQISHNYPSVTYHLNDRSQKDYRLSFTAAYVASQLLMAGIFTGWLWFYKGFTLRTGDAFERCLKWNFAGTWVFFLITSIRGEVQPQWTIIAFSALLILISVNLSLAAKVPAWVRSLAVTNIIIIVLVRVLMIVQPPFVRNIQAVKGFFGNRQWAKAVKEQVGDSWLVMNDGFQMPARYCFYNNTLKCFSFDSRNYRLTQFEIWPLEDSVQNKRVYYILHGFTDSTPHKLPTGTQTWYGGWVDSLRTYQRVTIDADKKNITAKAGQQVQLHLIIHNPYAYSIDFGNQGQAHKAALQAAFFQGKNEIISQQADSTFNQIKIAPGKTASYTFTFDAPSQKGDYNMVVSIFTDPLGGTRNSGYIRFTVE